MADNLKTTSDLANFGEMIPVVLFDESLMARSNRMWQTSQCQAGRS